MIKFKFSPIICIVSLLCVILPEHSKGQYISISGKVICNGKGVESVVVTDGNTCVTTDKKGLYTIQTSKSTDFVYLSTPSGYLPHDSLMIPHFYKRLNTNESKIYNFELKKNPKNDYNHTLLVHTDPQFYKTDNFNHYQKVIEDCQETINKYKNVDVFGIDCGDLVGDKPEFYPTYIEYLSKTEIPFYRVLGNHDMDYSRRTDETSTARYNKIFGPAYYSFNKGKIHYIILDNIFYIGRDYFYMGYISEKILNWLKEDLSYVPKGSTVFVSMHIPARLSNKSEFFKYDGYSIAEQTVNVSALFQVLESYNVHILTGHMHYNRNIIHSSTLYEHNLGAICGTWWQGDYCLDGSPIGYGVYEITGEQVNWYFKSVGYPRSCQMRAYPAGSNAEFPDDIIVNVWNWDKNWKIEWFENGKNMGEMTRFEGIDPKVTEMCSNKEKLEFNWISPIKTDHIFRATPQNKNSKIKINATDSFGNTYIAEL